MFRKKQTDGTRGTRASTVKPEYTTLITSSKNEGKVDNLDCYGCAHSAASHPYPGRPSGEWACCECIRAWKHREDNLTNYDPATTDLDHYIPLDQFRGPCASCGTSTVREGRLCYKCSEFISSCKEEEV